MLEQIRNLPLDSSEFFLIGWVQAHPEYVDEKL
jgi:hypothetical protein